MELLSFCILLGSSLISSSLMVCVCNFVALLNQIFFLTGVALKRRLGVHWNSCIFKHTDSCSTFKYLKLESVDCNWLREIYF